MPDQPLRFILGAILLVHGLGHIGPVGAYLWLRRRPDTDTSGWTAARSWLMPGLSPAAATVVASLFWVFAVVGFVVAAFSFWGILPVDWWTTAAVASAIVSLTGIVAFLGTWPAFNTVAAIVVNIGALVVAVRQPWSAP